jgi:hypothetical protein
MINNADYVYIPYTALKFMYFIALRHEVSCCFLLTKFIRMIKLYVENVIYL